MSISEASGRVSNPDSPESDSPEYGHIAETLDEIPPDPLLQSGSFIDVNDSTGENLTNTVAVQNKPTTKTEPVRMRNLSDDAVPISVAKPSNCVEAAKTLAPAPINAVFPTDSRPQRGRRKKSDKIEPEQAVPSAPSERPDWLPPGWFIEDRVRSSGATAGLVDKYYVEPVSGRKFRSKKEVLYFLLTGTKRKKGSTESPGIDIKSGGSSVGNKRKRSSSRVKSFAPSFDFDNVPEKVDWVLTDASEGSWTPFIGDEKMPESIKQEWNAAFESLAVGNTGGRVV